MSGTSMQAVAWTAYGPPEVLALHEVPRPQPKADEMLVRIVVSNVFPGDCEMRRLDVDFPWSLFLRFLCGFRRPKAGARLGQEYAGEVVAVGSAVTRFKPGDRVFGAPEIMARGTYAEFLTTKGEYATTMPDNLTFEAAAGATVGGLNALDMLKAGGVTPATPGTKLLLVGAGGSIGTMAIQIAKAYGAEVTVVDTTHKLPALQQAGADHVIDFTAEDFSARSEAYDVVIDIVGKNTPDNSLHRTLRAVRPGGCLVLGNPPTRHLVQKVWAARSTGKRIVFSLTSYRLSALEGLRELLASGAVTPLVDRSYPLAEVVDAHRFVESNRRIGNVVLRMPER